MKERTGAALVQAPPAEAKAPSTLRGAKLGASDAGGESSGVIPPGFERYYAPG